MLKFCPSALALLPEPEFFWLIIPVTKAPMLYLTPTPLSFGKQDGVLLQDLKDIITVLVIKMVLQVVPGLQGPRTAYMGITG